jgi:hypothetical protein
MTTERDAFMRRQYERLAVDLVLWLPALFEEVLGSGREAPMEEEENNDDD